MSEICQSAPICSTSKRIDGKRCGEQGTDWNPYYNQMFALDGGQRRYKRNAGSVWYGACMGFINGWDAKESSAVIAAETSAATIDFGTGGHRQHE